MVEPATSPSFFTVWRGLPLTMATAVAAFAYGIGFAFGMDERAPWWGPVGAVVVGLLFVASLVQAFLRVRRP